MGQEFGEPYEDGGLARADAADEQIGPTGVALPQPFGDDLGDLLAAHDLGGVVPRGGHQLAGIP